MALQHVEAKLRRRMGQGCDPCACSCRFYDASVFETIIRVLGGMLTAHELSGDAGFLTRCGPVTAPDDRALLSAPSLIKLSVTHHWQDASHEKWRPPASLDICLECLGFATNNFSVNATHGCR